MRGIVVFLAAAVLSIVPCLGAGEQVPGLDALWDQAEGYGVSQGTGLEEGLAGLAADALDQVGALARTVAATGVKVLAVVLLCALAQGARQGEEQGLQAVVIAGALAITALTMTDMAAMIGLGRETLGRMEDFSSALLPVMAVLTAATGGITAAAARQGATVLFSQLLLAAMDRLLIPMVYAYVALSCGHAALGDPGLKKLAALLKSGVEHMLAGLLLAFVGYLTASGAIAGSVDAAALKAARLAIAHAIPVVGTILADASESVLAGAGALRSTVGAAGLVVVLTICLAPFLRLGLQYLVYKCTAALSATVAHPRLSGLVDAIGSAFGLVLGMTGAGALIMLVSIISALSGALS